MKLNLIKSLPVELQMLIMEYVGYDYIIKLWATYPVLYKVIEKVMRTRFNRLPVIEACWFISDYRLGELLTISNNVTSRLHCRSPNNSDHHFHDLRVGPYKDCGYARYKYIPLKKEYYPFEFMPRPNLPTCPILTVDRIWQGWFYYDDGDIEPTPCRTRFTREFPEFDDDFWFDFRHVFYEDFDSSDFYEST